MMRKCFFMALAVALTSSVRADVVKAAAMSLPFAFGSAESEIYCGSPDAFGCVRPGSSVAQGDPRAFAFAFPKNSVVEGSSARFGYALPLNVLTRAFSPAFEYVLPRAALAASSSSVWYYPAGSVVASASSGPFVIGDALKPVTVPAVSIFGCKVPETPSEVQAQFLPTYEPFGVAGAKWTFAKAPKIKHLKGVFDQAAFDKDIAPGKTNLSGMKLKVDKKSGMISGSYMSYTLENGKLKKNKVAVNGVMIDGVGYGSGFTKKIGAMPAEIGNWDFGKD